MGKAELASGGLREDDESDVDFPFVAESDWVSIEGCL